MYMNYMIYILALIVAIIVILSLVFELLRSARENFDTYGSCVNQGYPFDWCLRVPVDVYNSESLCWCPAGQKIYKHYGRCYCQTYADSE